MNTMAACRSVTSAKRRAGIWCSTHSSTSGCSSFEFCTVCQRQAWTFVVRFTVLGTAALAFSLQ